MLEQSKKRKLLIIGSSQGVYGGIEAFMIALADAVREWSEFEVRLCFKIVKGYEVTQNLKSCAETICSEVFYVNRASKSLAKLIAWADVLHVQNTPPDIVFPARLLGKKVLLTVHNKKFPGLTLHNIIWSVSIKVAHRRWFNSNFVWSTWEPRVKSRGSARVPTICRLPQAWCPPEERKGFLFIGRWIENKGIEELLRAYAIVNPNPVEWPLIILGDGPLKSKVQDLVKVLGLENVQMPGFVDDESKSRYLSTARWLVAPASTQEDLGLTPIEARNVGVPSIVTKDGGLPESGGEAALLAEPKSVDDLSKCLQTAIFMDEIEYQRRGQIARDSLADFLEPICFYRQAYQS